MVLIFLLAFLFVSTVPSHPFDGTNSMLKSVSKRALEHVESVETDANRFCDHEGYFNPLRWLESEAGPAYLEWIMLMDKSSTAWLGRVSEPNFFTRDVLDWPDMDCGITYRGCVRMPTCDYILNKIGDEKSARQIYFILLSMNNINLISGVISEQSLAAQVNVASMSSNMATTFFWKHSDSADRTCKLQIAIIKGIVSSFINAFMIFMPIAAAEIAIAEGATLAVKAAEDAEIAAIKVLAEAREAVAFETNFIARRERDAQGYAEVAETTRLRINSLEAEQRGNPENAFELEAVLNAQRESRRHAENAFRESQRNIREAHAKADIASRKALKAWKTAKEKLAIAAEKRIPVREPRDDENKAPWRLDHIFRKGMVSYNKFATGKRSAVPFSVVGMPIAIGGNDMDSKWCAMFPNPTAEAEHVHQMALDWSIEKAGVKFREQVQSDMAQINKGVGFEDDGEIALLGESVLSDQIYDGSFVGLNAISHLRFVEEPFRVEKDITTHFKNAMISEILKEELCYLHCTPSGSGFSRSSSRFEPVPGIMCQAQCWRNYKIGKTVKMYGLDSLVKPNNDWDLDMQDYVSKSFRHWQEHRYDQTGPNLFPTIDDLFTGNITTSSGSYLPVCYSESIVPLNFKKKGKDESLPCICGDNIGNETLLFFREAGFEKWTANQNAKGLAMACQWSMSQAKAPPVQTFLSLCRFGWHYPLWHEKSDELQHGKDDMCDYMFNEQTDLLARGWDDLRVNCYICFTSMVGRAVAMSQQTSWRFNPYTKDFYSFQAACHTLDSNPQTSCLY